MRKNQIISIIIGILFIFSFSFLGMMQLKKIDTNLSLLKAVIPYPSRTIQVVNSFIKWISLDNLKDNKEIPSPKRKDGEDKFLKLLFSILNSCLVHNNKSLILLIIAFIGVTLGLSKSLIYRCTDISISPDIKFYLRWSLEFLTPLQKCIQNLSYKYDIDPIEIYGRAEYALKRNPHFVIK